MGIIYDIPKYKVIDPSPNFITTVGNFSFDDIKTITGLTAASTFGGYLAGASNGLRGPSGAVGLTIGVIGGFMVAYQSSFGRLMGFTENSGDVAAYTPMKRQVWND
ncbi:hypothetical protein CYMTET_52647 [Cymbomonas tetramitiformis]|uniref:NADH-ubiquinone oxidoreductase 21kDa subunit N-terminal domain-containing protein n=1 Tax=Cymbomonas tetramitiformis TaxID=36881 RepID=A0AAE0ER50_9CHLO|nr:hypothetical protein CYMTET_52647 [Cymbomonas tetramitiformis]